MTHSITKNTVASFLSLLLVAGVSITAFSASKEIVTDGKEKREATVIAKATVDPEFKVLDADADGKISLHEASKDSILVAQFNATDANRDGALTAEEYASYVSTSKKSRAVD